jgi:predicted transcriptional regulator
LELDESVVFEQLREIYGNDEDEDEVREVDLVIDALVEAGYIMRVRDSFAASIPDPYSAGEKADDDSVLFKLIRTMTVRHDSDGKVNGFKTSSDAPAILDEIRREVTKRLGKAKMAQIKLEVKDAVIYAWDTVIVDFRDYAERRPSQIRKDIDRLRNFWKRKRKKTPNMVVLWQQELIDKGNHFWWGKFEKLRIKPFAPEQLADFFIELFDDSPDPFTRDALVYVADAARGIFRRFKLYVKRCLMKYKVNPITVEHVREWLPSKDSEEVISQELSHVFPRSEDNRRRAVQVLQYLKENGPTSQPDITKQFFGSANLDRVACLRLIGLLEEHGYIQRSYEGHKKMISLTEESDKNE